MNKEELIINYCKNTSLDGFEAESEENRGEQWLAKICVDMLNAGLKLDVVEKSLDLIVINSKFNLEECFFNGVDAIYNDIKDHIQIINNPSFKDNDDWKYELENGVFSK